MSAISVRPRPDVEDSPAADLAGVLRTPDVVVDVSSPVAPSTAVDGARARLVSP